MRSRSWRLAIACGLALLVGAAGSRTVSASAAVHLVCQPGVSTLPCGAGTFTSIQAAVDASSPGDWVLVAPGDYHEKSSTQPVGVWITTPNITLRGMDRNSVVVDGTNPGDTVPCTSNAALQDFSGRNGIEVSKADGVSIENLTVCNYLDGSNAQGNEIWWNGGDGSGLIGLNSLYGSYLTASTTYTDPTHAPQYAIFTSNEDGPGTIIHTYGSNMSDSNYYVGACADCNVDINDAHSENSVLGFSGSNAGGHLIIENSEFDQNRAGIVPNSLNNDDWPTPQNGACPTGTAPGPTGTFSCTIIRNNKVHDNNNPNTPGSGIAANSAIGTGIEMPGDENDVITGNTIYNNAAWGVVVHDFPDAETPPSDVTTPCRGGTEIPQTMSTPAVCYFVAFGNETDHNTLYNNGTFGNPTNADLGDDHQPHNPGNCYHDNTDPNNGGPPTSDPPSIETFDGTPCFPTGTTPPASGNYTDQALLTAELACATGVAAQCPQAPIDTPAYPGYPTQTQVTLLPIPKDPGMANPCDGVPDNAWCANGQLVVAAALVPEAPLVLLLPAAAALLGGGLWRRSRRRLARPLP